MPHNPYRNPCFNYSPPAIAADPVPSCTAELSGITPSNGVFVHSTMFMLQGVRTQFGLNPGFAYTCGMQSYLDVSFLQYNPYFAIGYFGVSDPPPGSSPFNVSDQAPILMRLEWSPASNMWRGSCASACGETFANGARWHMDVWPAQCASVPGKVAHSTDGIIGRHYMTDTGGNPGQFFGLQHDPSGTQDDTFYRAPVTDRICSTVSPDPCFQAGAMAAAGLPKFLTQWPRQWMVDFPHLILAAQHGLGFDGFDHSGTYILNTSPTFDLHNFFGTWSFHSNATIPFACSFNPGQGWYCDIDAHFGILVPWPGQVMIVNKQSYNPGTGLWSDIVPYTLGPTWFLQGVGLCLYTAPFLCPGGMHHQTSTASADWSTIITSGFQAW